MRAKMSNRDARGPEYINNSTIGCAVDTVGTGADQLAVDEARAILAETEPTETDSPFGAHLAHHCIRTIPADVQAGWWGDDERSALAEALTAFVALDLDS